MGYSTFLGLETARRGLSASRTGLNTTGHNVANAGTPGYTRQRTVQEASYPYTDPSLGRPEMPGQLGTGILIKHIERVRNEFLDHQIRTEINTLGNWEVQRDALTEIETIFMEPSSNGLNALFSSFWAGWQELSKNAESAPIRTALVQNAVSLANAFNHTSTQLDVVQGNLNQLRNIYLGDIESKAGQIAALTSQIMNIKAIGDQPNDLMDRRDLLLDDLAKLTNIKVTDLGGGSIRVEVVNPGIGTTTLVDGRNVGDLTNLQDHVTNGALHGINQASGKLQDYLDSLNSLAASLITEVNLLHRQGFNLNGNDGADFFTGANAADIAVRPEICANVSLVAASSVWVNPPGDPGNGANALAIARLQYTGVDISGSNVTINGFYNNLVARLGVETQESIRMVENQQALVDQLNMRKESISGVSIDEEMTSLLQYQYAYQASARVITILDQMLDTLINRTAV